MTAAHEKGPSDTLPPATLRPTADAALDSEQTPERADASLLKASATSGEKPSDMAQSEAESVSLDALDAFSPPYFDHPSRIEILARTRHNLVIDDEKAEFWWQAIAKECAAFRLFFDNRGASKKKIERLKSAARSLDQALRPFKNYDFLPEEIQKLIHLLPALTSWLNTGHQSRPASRPKDEYPILFLAKMASLYSHGFALTATSNRNGSFVAFVVTTLEKCDMEYQNTWVEYHTLHWLAVKKKASAKATQNRY